MFSYRIDDDTELHIIQRHHAEAFFKAIDTDREFLGQWLGWVHNLTTVDDAHAFVERDCNAIGAGTRISLLIAYKGELAGGINLVITSKEHKKGEIGYWLKQGYNGKGIMTRATRFMTDFGVRYVKLNRIVIRCAIGNVKSQAIPERIGYTREAMSRASYLVDDELQDVYIYSMLADEWTGMPVRDNVHVSG